MTTSTEVKKTKASYTLNDVEDLCKRARGAGATGGEPFRIHVTPGDRFGSDQISLSVAITEREPSRVDPY